MYFMRRKSNTNLRINKLTKNPDGKFNATNCQFNQSENSEQKQ